LNDLTLINPCRRWSRWLRDRARYTSSVRRVVSATGGRAAPRQQQVMIAVAGLGPVAKLSTVSRMEHAGPSHTTCWCTRDVDRQPTRTRNPTPARDSRPAAEANRTPNTPARRSGAVPRRLGPAADGDDHVGSPAAAASSLKFPDPVACASSTPSDSAVPRAALPRALRVRRQLGP
jgi:hypothetical protein